MRKQVFFRSFSSFRRSVRCMNASVDHKSAICFIPSRRSWNEIQEIRCFNDKAFVRWPPHINLLYPFWNYSTIDFSIAANMIRKALQPFQPFMISLRQFRFFEHGNSCTIWLEPESEDLIKLQEALYAVFPECYHLNNDPSRLINKFVPHLSVGQWRTRQAAEEAITNLSISFKPLQIESKEVMMIHRTSHQRPFEFKTRIPLGSEDDNDIEEINTGYVASLGPSSDSCDSQPYGLGSYAEGVWNFAYGSNIKQSKLVQDRNITPLESIHGILPGYHLCFNHHGGMGNVERMSQRAENFFKAKGIHGVHGILHRLSPTDIARLTNMESGYRPVEHYIETTDGRGPVLALVYESPPSRHIKDGLPPSDRYLSLIKSGAREWKLDSSYIQWLETIPTISEHNRGPLYWRTPDGVRIQDRVIRVGADPPKDRRKYLMNVKRRVDASS